MNIWDDKFSNQVANLKTNLKTAIMLLEQFYEWLTKPRPDTKSSGTREIPQPSDVSSVTSEVPQPSDVSSGILAAALKKYDEQKPAGMVADFDKLKKAVWAKWGDYPKNPKSVEIIVREIPANQVLTRAPQ